MTLEEFKREVAKLGENPTEDQICSIGPKCIAVNPLSDYRKAVEIYIQLVDNAK